MFYDAAKRDHGLAVDPLKALIVPRPIGWISTVDAKGRVNLAPYSFYNGVGEFPPMVYFAITGTYGDNPTKHSRLNAEETGEFVVNMVAGHLAEKMNINPYHFNIVQTAAVGIGLFLPPMGVGLLMALKFANLSVGQHWRTYLPYIGALMLGLLLIILFPEISLFLPRAVGAIR